MTPDKPETPKDAALAQVRVWLERTNMKGCECINCVEKRRLLEVVKKAEGKP